MITKDVAVELLNIVVVLNNSGNESLLPPIEYSQQKKSFLLFSEFTKRLPLAPFHPENEGNGTLRVKLQL